MARLPAPGCAQKRRELMDTLAAYCDCPVSADVIPLRAAMNGNEKRDPSL